MSRKKLAVVLTLLLALNLAVGWLFQANATPAPAAVFLPDFESTLQLVQVDAPLEVDDALPAQLPDPVAPASAQPQPELIESFAAAPNAQPSEPQLSSEPQRCAVWGPYDSATEAQQRAGALGEAVQQVRYSSELIEKKPHYLVYIGPYQSSALARQAFDKLKADGLDAFVLTRGRLKNAISVGLYAGPKTAQKQLKRIRALGYNALQTKRKRMRRVHHMSAWVADDGQSLPGETTGSVAASCAAVTNNIAAVVHSG